MACCIDICLPGEMLKKIILNEWRLKSEKLKEKTMDAYLTQH